MADRNVLAKAAELRVKKDKIGLLILKNIKKEREEKERSEKESAKRAEILERDERASAKASANSQSIFPFSGKSRTLGSGMKQPVRQPTLKLNTSPPMKHDVETALILKMVETIIESEVSSEEFQMAKYCFLGLLKNDDDHQILLKECYATIRAKLDSEDPQFSEDLQCSELQEAQDLQEAQELQEAFRRSKIDF